MKDISTIDSQANSVEDQLSKKEANNGRARILIAAVLALLPIVYFFPAVMGKVTLAPGDGWTQILGIRMLIGQMIRDGHLPLWNPYIFAGMPLLASIQPGALYPLTWLFAVFSTKAAMNAMVISTYHVALIGAYLYARRIGSTRSGAMVTGVAFAFGGYMISHLGHTNRIAAAAWAPLILLAIEAMYQRLEWRWVSLGALFIALQLFAGEPQMTFYTALVAGAYCVFSLCLREEREKRLRFAFGATALAICGVLLSAIQLLPMREMLAQGERAQIPYEYFAGYSFPPQHYFSLLFPWFFGGSEQSIFSVIYWGRWNTTEIAGYVGMLTWLLALIAIFAARRSHSLVWFWTGCAVVALLLALGDYLPFGLNHRLYQIPVYSLFRASGRHLFEFTFAVAVLAGMGATRLERMDRAKVLRATRRSIVALAVVVVIVVTVYRFFQHFLVMPERPLPPGAGSLKNAELLVTLGFFILSVGLLWVAARRWSVHIAVAMVVLLCLDVAHFGYFYEWRIAPPNLLEELADPPTVRLIKDREPDLNAFRIIGHSPDPHGKNYQTLNFPNVSIARGLQSVNGYDPMRINRTATLAGSLSIIGIAGESQVFGGADQSLNLLNVKYLFLERGESGDQAETIEHDGIRFFKKENDFKLMPGTRERFDVKSTATELAIITTMADALDILNGATVARIKLRAAGGGVIERELRAGLDTSEWAHDRAQPLGQVKHDRARVIESWPAEGFQGHNYLARLSFDRAEIQSVEFEYAEQSASLNIVHAALYDATTGVSRQISLLLLPERWRPLGRFGDVELFENLKFMPRAWFVRRQVTYPQEDVLRTIKSGRMKDGSAFDPADAALFAREDYGGRDVALPAIGDPTGASVQITRYQPQRIELRTSNQQPGFLVLSETYYRGWEAWIDGKRAPVERANYALRGLSVPAGDHSIEFVFRAHSFRNGAAWSLLGILLLFIGASGRTRRALARLEEPAPRIFISTLSKLKSLLARFLIAAESKLSAISRSKFVLIVAVIGLLIYGGVLMKFAVYSVGGSDTYGYLRIAHSILNGDIVQRVKELDLLGLPDEFARIFIPLANDPGPRPGTAAPFYSVGLPLIMALGALIGGLDYGPFLVVPIAGTLCLLFIYLVGMELGLPRGFSFAGAVMLAASPTFIFMALQPMSDAAATLWALVTIWGSLRSRKRDGWALLAGGAFGLAFLTRPSSVLLLIPILFSLRLKPKTVLFFLLGGLPLAAIFFAYNIVSYGHPLQTGYWSTNHQDLMMTSGFADRFNHYRYWLTVTLSPLLPLGWLSVAADRRVDWRNRAMLISWFGAFFLFYSCYDIWGDWWYTRFLLPGVPAIILGALLVARDVIGLTGTFVSERNLARLKWIVLIILVAVTLSHERRNIARFDVFSIGAGELTHPDSCRWADRMLPNHSFVVSMQMSGALKFYTERPILRWDIVEPMQWSVAQKHAAERGYRWYALLHPFEIEDAQKRLGGKWTKLGMYKQVSLWQIEPASD